MVKIAFHDNSLCERGTTTALYDYAYYNKHYLNNESIIIYNNTNDKNILEVIKKFNKEFKLYSYEKWDSVDYILELEKCDILYMIKAGNTDNKQSKYCKNIIHCVFNTDELDNTVYGKISNTFGSECTVVPHMINLPNIDTNLRHILNIPENAFVFGRYGGYDQFDIEYVHSVIDIISDQYPDIYFLFANTQKFCKLKNNLIFLEAIIDLEKKTEFINTCDVMIHARKMGETFGLAVGEFSTRNKPILTSDMGEKNHLSILKDKCFIYQDASSLYKLMIYLFNNKDELKQNNWNMYNDYSPGNIMNLFNEKFIL